MSLQTYLKLGKDKKSAVFWEINIFVAILILLNFLLIPQDLGFHNVGLNPFYLLVLLVAIRYGIGWGYCIAILSSIYYMATPPYSGAYIIGRLPETAVFFGLILIFGPIHEQFADRISELTEKVNQLDKRDKELNERYEMTLYLKEDYEKRVLTQTSTMADLYSDARNMQVLDTGDLYQEIVNLAIKYIDAGKSSIYILEDGDFILKAKAGFEDFDPGPSQKINMSVEPYDELFGTKDVVAVNEKKYKDTVIADVPVYSGPLIDSSGRIIGVLNVDNLTLMKFNRISLRMFSLICSWASRAIENAVNYRISEGRRIIRPETHIFKYEYFILRLEEALEMHKNTKSRFSAFSVEIKDWERIPEKNRNSVQKFVSRVLQQYIREFDILAHFKNENQFAVLMPNISSEEIEGIINKINLRLHEFDLKPFEDDETLSVSFHTCANLSEIDGKERIIRILSGGELSKTED